MRKNQKNPIFDCAQVRQRFSIRKLTIGTASVLLGTLLYLGNNGQIAHADSADQSTETQVENKSNVSASKQNKVVNGSKNVLDSKQTSSVGQPNENSTLEEVKNGSNNQQSSVQNKLATSQSEEQLRSNQTIAQSETIKSTSVQNLSTIPSKVGSLKAQAVNQSLNDNKVAAIASNNESVTGDKLTVDNNTVLSGNDLTFTFSTDTAQKGDVYKIEIPESDSNFDASGTYKVEGAQFQGDYGSSSTSYDANTHTWIVTDTFTKPNTSAQAIILSTDKDFRTDKLQSTGSYNRVAKLYKNNNLIQTLNFTQEVDPDKDLFWKTNEDITTQEGRVVAQDSSQAAQNPILANQDYNWNLSVQFNPNFNHGTTIDVPMPTGFQLDETATKAANTSLSNYNISFAQEGDNIRITLPELTDGQLKALNLNRGKYGTTIDPVIVGKFALTTPDTTQLLKPETGSKVELNYNSGDRVNTQAIDPLPALVTNKSFGTNKKELGEMLSGKVLPDTYSYNSDGTRGNGVTSLDNTKPHDLNTLKLSSSIPYDLSNLQLNLDVPDGMNVTSVMLGNSPSCAYTLTLDNGQEVSGNYTLNGQSPFVSDGRTIKHITLKYADFSAYGSIGDVGLYGTLAKNYSNGQPLEAGQTLHTEFTVSSDGTSNATWAGNQIIVDKTPVQPIHHQNQITSSGTQTVNAPGAKDAGEISATGEDLVDDPANLTFYVTLPTNANVDTIKDNTGKDLDYQIKQINGRNVAVISGGFSRDNNSLPLWIIKLNNSNLITKANLNSDYAVYVQLPQNESLTLSGNESKINSSDFPYVDNTYRLGSGEWRVLAAIGTYNASQAQGNENQQPTVAAQSDDKGTDQMTFINNVVNGQDKPLQNVTIISKVPTTADGKSQFDFTLKQNGVSVEKSTNSQTTTLTDGYTQYYSTDDIDLNTIHNDSNYKTKFVTADQVQDWSKIKAVLTEFNQVDPDSIYNVVMKGKDDNFVNDVGKTAYASNVVWTDSLAPLVIGAGEKGSANITISGQSTLHFKLHFDDNSHPDIEVPALDKTYTDDKDIINKSDFINTAIESDFDEAVSKKDYSKIPKAVIDAIPDGYVLDVTNCKIENSSAVYPDGRKNGTAQFDQVAKYDDDGDTVVYNLVKKVTFNQSIDLIRNINYVDENGKTIKSKDTTSTQIEVSRRYNPLTGYVDPISTDLSALLKAQGFDWGATSTSAIGDYRWIKGQGTVNDGTNVIGDLSTLLNAPVDPSKISQGHYYSFDGRKVTEDTTQTAPADTLEIVQNITQEYVPSHANLIIMGLGNGDETNLLESSTGDNPNTNSKITFTNTDATLKDLKGSGYTYKVYYISGSLNKILSSQSSKEASVSFKDFDKNSLAEISSAKMYSSLSGALKDNPDYDDLVDSDSAATTPALGYTQNFVVVYTSATDRKQTVYVLSDNDPYKNNAKIKDLALPQTTQEADKSGTDYFKNEGTTGNSLLQNYNGFLANGTSNTYATGMSDYDAQGNLINHIIPGYDPNNPMSAQDIGSYYVYAREGYYISEATYQYTDAAGKVHQIVIKDNYNKTPVNPADTSTDVTGQTHLFQLLQYLADANKNNPSGDKNYVVDLDLGKNSPFEITIDGMPNATITTTSDGIKQLKLGASQAWTFDNTDYDPKLVKADPAPQIISLHYTPYVLADQHPQVHIHYINVDDSNALDEGTIEGLGYTLNKDTSKYGQGYLGQWQEWDPQQEKWIASTSTVSDPITYTLADYSSSYNNDDNDKKIVDELAKLGYVVVQRDHQTLGTHTYDPYSSDETNGSIDGNAVSVYDGSENLSKNYYVYLKKAGVINYQVVAEDENGNITKTLLSPTQLGVGGVSDNIASSRFDPNSDTDLETISEKYASIVNSINTAYPNYELVPSSSTDSKLKKTDVLDSSAVFKADDPQLLTIYVVNKKGNVHIHYIDVDGKAASSEGYVPTDGTEIVSHQQNITNQNYGDTYTNTLWDYGADNYALATSTLPMGATSGTIDSPDKDVYVYLNHKTSTSTEKKIVKETIHYIYEDRSKAHDDYSTVSSEFTKTDVTDLVTKQVKKGNWTPASYEFGEVDSPVIAGYTPDQASISAIAVNPYSADIEKTVMYKADTQKATLRFYDDTEGKFIDATPDLNASGKSATGISFTIPSSYDFSNYVFRDVTGGSEPDSGVKLAGSTLSTVQYGNFDKDDNTDQVFIAHFIHSTELVPETKTVKEVVHYTYEDGSKAADDHNASVSFNRTNTKDLVTGNVTNGDWNKESDKFAEVDSPIIAGYTPDQKSIGEITVTPDSKDIEKTVIYKADNQKAKLRFYDDTEGKFIDAAPDLNASGESASAISFAIPTNYDFSNYKFEGVTNGSDPKSQSKLAGDTLPTVQYGNFDKDDNTDQVFIAHFTHGTELVPEAKTVKEVIHYIYEDGSKAAEDHDTSVNFNRTNTKDLVTGNVTNGDWNKESDKFAEVDSPIIAGYTPDQKSIGEITVTPDSKDIEKTVIYKADTQKAKLRFYDDTEGKFIDAAPDLNASGKSATGISFTIPSSYDFSNYKFEDVTNGSDPSSQSKLVGGTLSTVQYGKFDKDDNTDQVFVAHFTHSTEPVLETKTVKEIIHYIYEDGSRATDDHNASVSFNRTNIKDLVTNKVTNGNWNHDSAKFNEVDSPIITGYTPDQKSIAEITVTPDSKDIEKTVIYKSDTQKAKLRFYDDTEGKFIEAAPDLNVSGKSAKSISFTIPSSYDFSNYVFRDVTNGSEPDSRTKLTGDTLSTVQYGNFDKDDNIDQVFVAHFTHGTEPVPETKTVKEVIHYIYEDGSKAAADHNASVSFSRTNTKDLVTGKITNGNWNKESDKFADVDSPTIAGYTPDQKSIAEITVTPNSKDIEKTVIYNADTQNAKLRFYDDTEGKFIEAAPDLKDSGKSATAISFDIPTSYDFSNYKFEAVSNGSDPSSESKLAGTTLSTVQYGNFDKDDNIDQVFVAHFTHGTESIPETKPVKEVIHYIYEDGSQAKPDHTASINFTRTSTKDLVTGKVTDGDWNKELDEFTKVDSPTITGYTPDQANIAEITVTPDSRDVEKTVIYNADSQKATLRFYDDTEEKFIDAAPNLDDSGKSAEAISFNIPTSYNFSNYVFRDVTSGSEPDSTTKLSGTTLSTVQYGNFDKDDNTDQVFIAHFIHGIESIPETKTVKEVIHYIYEDGSKAAGDHNASVSFNRTNTKDLATGNVTNGSWNKNSDDFAEVDSPTITGYTPDPASIAEITVTPDSKDVEKTVVYKANNQNAKLRFYDDTEGKFIETAPDLKVSGKSASGISFDIPSSYDFSNYNFEDATNGSDPKSQSKLAGDTLSTVKYGNFDKDDNTDQVFIAHFTHSTEPVPETKTVHEVVHYIYEDGSKAAEDYNASVSFNRTNTKDLVTGKVSDGNWNKESDKFVEVDSPTIVGYTPDQKRVAEIIVTPDSKDIEKTVIYTADAQKAKLRFYDDTEGKFIEIAPDLNASGKSATVISFAIPTSYNFSNYVFRDVTSGNKPDSTTKLAGNTLSTVQYGNFDKADNIDQVFIAHFIHGTEPVPEAKTVKEVIHYIYEDGSRAADDHNASVSFNRTNIKDLVTNKVTNGNWNHDSAKFNEVDSPTITGYTPDQKSIAEITVTPGSEDVEKTVTYRADVQKATLRFYDDTEGKFIEAPDLNDSGKSATSINFDIPSSYDFSNYKFEDVTNGADPSSESKLAGGTLSTVQYGNFDKDDNTDQVFIAHFIHGIESIPETKTVKEVIHYIYEDGSKAAEDHNASVSFNRTNTKDLVTGNVTNGRWNKKSDEFAEVDSPAIIDYTPDQKNIAAITVTPDSKNIEKTVIYKANTQKATLRFYDDTEGKFINAAPDLDDSGDSAEAISFNIPTSYDFSNYVFRNVTSGSEPDSTTKLTGTTLSTVQYGNFDKEDNTDQVFIAHFTHGMDSIPETKPVKEVIHYIYEDGSKAANNHNDSVNFTRTNIKDLVTGKITNENWNHDSAKFAEVDSPTITGYIPDQKSIAEITVTPDSKDVEKTVIYKANTQNAKLRFYDDTAGKFIDAAPDLNDSGKSTEAISFNIPTSYDFSNYVFRDVTSGSEPDSMTKLAGDTLSTVKYGNFDKDDNTDQVFIAHFAHSTELVPETKTVHEVVHYIYEDGSKAADDHDASVSFNRTNTKDLVTGKITNSNWSKETDKFAEVDSPEIEGYTPDQTSIAEITVIPDSKDVEKTVIYKIDTQKATLRFYDDTEGKFIEAPDLNASGKSGGVISFDIPSSYDFSNYKFEDVTSGNEPDSTTKLAGNILAAVQYGKFDKDANTDQVFIAHFAHNTEPVLETRTVKEIIRYIYQDGSKAAEDHNASVSFNRTNTKDLVTSEITNSKWNKDSDNFSEVDSPAITGYTPDQKNIAEITVTPDSKDIEKTVIYNTDTQKAKLRFYDDTEGKFIETTPDLGVSGKSGGVISFDIPVSYDFSNYKFEGATKGSDPMSQNKLSGNNLVNVQYGDFDKDDSTDQVFIAHFTHNTESVTETKTVKEVIHYVYEDGSKAANDHTVSVSFTRTNVKDLVTNKLIYGNWNKNSTQLPKIISPTITGYTPDQASIAEITVTPDSENIDRTVIYAPSTTPKQPSSNGTPTKVPTTPKAVPDTPTKSSETKTPTELSSKRTPQAEKTSRPASITHVSHGMIYNNENVSHNSRVQVVAKSASRKHLPQTDAKESKGGLVGLALASLGILLGFADDRKRR